MSKKYKNKYRISSARLQNWDYTNNAGYFITICTKNREYYFGDIAEGKMQLSGIGKIAEKHWREIPNHFSFVEFGEFIIMPNHVHGIIIIDKPVNANAETPKLGVSTLNVATKNWKPGSLGVIINQYKRICTINSRKIHADFEWQARYYDHIIRNEKSFQRITRYIAENPRNWTTDNLYNKLKDT